MAKHSACAEAWRDQTGKTRDAGSVFYRGEVIYSYGRHFPMARLVRSPGGVVIFVTTKGYSGSTSAHLGIVREAVKAMERFDVPDVMAQDDIAHAANFRAMLADTQALIEQADRARTLGDHYRRKAEEKRRSAYRYAHLFGIVASETE